jgi:hypothetical protein
MDQKPINPLVKHFRRPAIYFKLPSKGSFWEEGTLDLTVNGEIPIYPMTTADEITLKTPDALMNGSGVVSVIQSCCPNIKNAWKMPSTDVDATLIAIRVASYGKNMAISATCPHCNEEHDYEVDITALLSQVTAPTYEDTVNYDGLKIKLKPQNYTEVNQSNIASFEQQRILDALLDKDMDEEVKNTTLASSMKNMLEANLGLLVNSTEYIETEDGVRVKEKEFIREFYQNSNTQATKLIEEKLAEFSRIGSLPPVHLGCSECQKEFDTALEFDYARFFG